MHVAFIGGTRFIGHTAASAAAWRGHKVSVLHRGRHPNELDGVEEVIVDRNDPSALCEALKRLSPDVVVDTRAMTRSEAEVTVLALKVVGVPGVVLSSQDVYAQFGRLNGHPAPPLAPLVDEDAELTVPYPFRGLAEHEGGPDYDKKEVEAALRESLSDGVSAVTVLRLPAVYGARDPKRRFGPLVDRLDAGERELPCSGGASFRWTHAHVRDVAHAIALAAERVSTGFSVYNVGEDPTPTMRERADAIARHFDAEIRWQESTAELPAGLELFGAYPNDFVADSSRIRAELGWSEVTTPAERVADVVSWSRSTRS
jgi:nucleoside-diphosphate-sugar epimerase